MTDLEVILMIIHPTAPFYRDKTETQDLISATQMLGVGQMAGKGSEEWEPEHQTL
jgi:hypothetical protein